MKSKQKILLRVILFNLVFLMLFCFLNGFFQPVWFDWNNYYTTHGFYEEPEDTIETVFLGPSTIVDAVIPTELYENYGICAYNLATEQQPVLASYYLLEEVYRLHSESLKTVIFDISSMRSASSEAFYHKAFDAMEFSDVKYRAVKDYVGGGLKDTLNFLIPFLSYHDRWSSIESSDFEKFTADPVNGTRGYNLEFKIYSESTANMKLVDTVLDESAEPEGLRKEGLEYLDRMVTFCEEKGLNLVLMKTPTRKWSSSLHNAVDILADKYGLRFLDFNYPPLYDAFGYVHTFDTTDGNHFNYYGAAKLTDWFGKYLVEECGATDIRENEKYAYMEDQLSEYKDRIISQVELREEADIAGYLETALKYDNTVFISVNDDGAKKLTEEQRAYFSEIGLEKLSELSYRDSYLAVMDNGGVIYEEVKSYEKSSDKKSISYTGSLNGNTSYKITSGGYKHGKVALCEIGSTQYAENSRGINITVYNNNINEVINSVVFDTFASSYREVYTMETAAASSADKS